MKSKGYKSLRGAVLIMVLTVMFVLIIMLMATLTVVSTAGQRIYTKYEENQAYYTARSALDVFTQNLLSDADYYAYNGSSKRQFEYTDNTVSPAVETSADMKQGKALQLDLYKIRSQAETALDEGYTEGANTYNDLKWAENAVLDDNTFKAGSPEDENYSLSKTDSYTKNGTTYTGLEYIEYDVTLPEVDDGSSKYAKMVDTDKSDKDGDGKTDDQVARIKVEVLDRHYATDPTYTASQMAEIVNGSDVTKQANLQAAIQNGQRSKDYMKIKVTATVELEGVKGTAIVIFETTNADVPSSDNAINSFGGLTGSGAGLVAAGGASSLNTGTTTIDASGTAGTIFALGTLAWNSTGSSSFDDGASVYARGGINFTNSQTITAVGQDVFIYTDGLVDITSSFTYGSTQYPMSIICDEFKYGNGITVTGNIYTNKMHLGGNNGAQSVGANANVYTNDLYLPASAVEISDSLITIKNSLASSINVYGDIYIGDDWSGYTQYPSYMYTYENVNNVNQITSGNFDILTKTAVADSDGIVKAEVTLPASLPSGNTDTITLETVQSRYSNFFVSDAFDENGEIKNKSTGVADDGSYTADNIKEWVILAESSYYTSNNLDEPDTPTLNIYTDTVSPVSGVISTSGLLASSTGNCTIDTGSAGNIVTLQLKPGVSYGGEIEVTGSGTLNIIMPESTADVGYNFQNFYLFTSDIDKQAGGTVENGVTKAPKIFYFAGEHANINITNNAFFVGYFYMPLSTMTNSSGNNGVNKTYIYNGTTTTKNYFIVGSITCGDYNTGGSQSGVCYLDKDSGADTPGEPHLTVQASQYTRN